MFKSGLAKIGDMNVSTIMKNEFLQTQTGTPLYSSPQIWKAIKYTEKTDIWSLGCVLFELATGSTPFAAETADEITRRVMRGHFSRVPEIYSQDLHNMIRALLQTVEILRPTARQVLSYQIVMDKMKGAPLLEPALETPLMKTIRMPDDFDRLESLLPQPNYEPIFVRRRVDCVKGAKNKYGIRSFIDELIDHPVDAEEKKASTTKTIDATHLLTEFDLEDFAYEQKAMKVASKGRQRQNLVAPERILRKALEGNKERGQHAKAALSEAKKGRNRSVGVIDSNDDDAPYDATIARRRLLPRIMGQGSDQVLIPVRAMSQKHDLLWDRGLKIPDQSTKAYINERIRLLGPEAARAPPPNTANKIEILADGWNNTKPKSKRAIDVGIYNGASFIRRELKHDRKAWDLLDLDI